MTGAEVYYKEYFSTAEEIAMDGLIGYTGFVGGNLRQQRNYDFTVNSKNFHELENRHFHRLVCAGIPAVKWKANRDPEADLAHINELVDVLKTVSADKVVLISTIDVYSVNSGVDERFDCHNPNHHAYGRHRLYFEDFCRGHFPNLLVVRLPGLFGGGIKKNVIFDLLNDNCLEMIQPESSFQYYDLSCLSDDIERAEAAGLPLINLFTEPVRTREIIDRFFPGKKVGEKAGPAVSYDMHTAHAGLWGKTGPYCYSRSEVLAQLGRFIGNYGK